jgi:hypothetical protein
VLPDAVEDEDDGKIHKSLAHDKNGFSPDGVISGFV